MAPPSTEELCRALTMGEQMWLAQSSLICVIARVSPGTNLDTGRIQAAIANLRKVQPYLNICVDPEAKRFRIAPEMPVSSEFLESDDAEAVRNAARAQLIAGVDRNVTFARVHSTTSPNGTKHLMAFCDHLAFDAKSLVVLLTDISKSLNSTGGDQMEAEVDADAEMLPFVDWTSVIPETSLAPFEGVDSIMLKTKTVAPEDLAACPAVQGLIFPVEPATFLALKAAAKRSECTLNGPLMTAFFAAVTECAREQLGQDAPQGESDIRSCCAVDLRAKLNLPSNYMNNSASISKCSAVIPASCDINGGSLWAAALTAQQGLLDALAAGEGFRLHDITKRMAFAEMGPVFAIPCLWSNVGHMGSKDDKTLEACEVMITGAGSNHIISGHAAEAGGALALTITYAPAFHTENSVKIIGGHFVRFVNMLANSA